MKFERVARWNSLRYAQEFVAELQVNLAREEYKETCEAIKNVDSLDGHIDQIYVAMGGLWKLGLGPAEAYSFLEVASAYSDLVTSDLDYSEVMQCISESINHIEYVFGPRLAMTLANIVALNYRALMLIGYTQEECLAAADIVCDSNDSKSVKKTASDVKANAGDKGALFIDPTPRLQTIVDTMLARRQ